MTASKAQEKPTTAVTVVQPAAVAMPVQTMNDLMSIGQMLAQSGMFGVTNPSAGMVVALTCYQTGQTLFDFGRTYHIINGRPAMKADAMAAEFRKKGGRYKVVERTAEKAAAEFTFEGDTNTFAFTMEEARQAGLVKENSIWSKYPANMLWARMMSNALRVLCPELVAGVYTPEEVESISDGPAPVPAGPDAAQHVQAIVSPSPVQTATEPAPAADPAPQPEPDFSKTGPGANPQSPATQAADPNVCPIGQYTGKLWAEIPLVDLRKAAALPADYNPALTQAHRKAIAAVIQHKESGGEE